MQLFHASVLPSVMCKDLILVSGTNNDIAIDNDSLPGT